MKKLTILVLVFVMLAGSIPIMTENAQGSTVDFPSTSAMDGSINCYDETYSKALSGINNTVVDTATSMNLGQRLIPTPAYYTYRSFLTFDTSAIVDTDSIISATLYLRVNLIYPPANFQIEVTNTDYGVALDQDDWNATGTYEGIIADTTAISGGDWISLSLDTSKIDKTGNTQYFLTASNDASTPTDRQQITFYTAESSYDPYIEIVSEPISGAEMVYVDGATWETVNGYPAYISSWNATHEQIRFDYWVAQQDYINFSVDSGMEYQSIIPPATVTDYGTGFYNVTINYEKAYYSMWFLREKALVETTIHIALYHSTLGEGFFWEKWQVAINTGTSYDNTTASRVWNPDYQVTYGDTYTVTVLDYFNNHITNTSFVANALDMDISVSVPVYQMNIKSFRTDTTAYAIYYNSTGTPYQDHCPSEELKEMAVREGLYMFRFDWLDSTANGSTTVSATTFYNLTIDATYTINIGNNQIEIISTNINSNTITINTIESWVTPSVLVIGENLPVAPVEGIEPLTRSGTEPSNEIIDDGVLLHPYAVTEASTLNSVNGQAGTLYDPTPSAGTTTILTDELYISGNYSTNIMLNVTATGVNFLNLTYIPGLVDITAYSDSENLTYWANRSISIVRKTTFRNSAVFWWTYYATSQLYDTSLVLNNTTPFDWYDISWMVPFVPESEGGLTPDLQSAVLRDIDNSAWLTHGTHYLVSMGGYHMNFDHLNNSATTTDTRSFTFKYYADNGTNAQTEITNIQAPYYMKDLGTISYYYGLAIWQNPKSLVFTGDLQINILDAGGQINPDEVRIVDLTNDRALSRENNDFTVSGSTVLIQHTAVPDLGNGEEVQYGIYFHIYEPEESDTSWLFANPPGGSPLSINGSLIALGGVLALLGMGLYVGTKQKAKGGFIFITGLCLFLLFGMLSAWNQIGAL